MKIFGTGLVNVLGKTTILFEKSLIYSRVLNPDISHAGDGILNYNILIKIKKMALREGQQRR